MPVAPARATQRAIVERPTVRVDPAAAPSQAKALDLSEPVIRKAIADSRDAMDDVVMPHFATFGAGGPAPQPGQAAIDQGFRRAEIPTCMTPEAFRFDSPQVGPFGLGGFFAWPFLVHAIVTGQCRN